MTSQTFIQPRFVGPRFEGAMLPLAAARDLAAYEELVIELAKHLYRQKHTDRERIPKGFAAGFSISIQRIDPGSAKPALVAAMLVGAGQLLASEIPQEIFNSRDLINEVIAAETPQAYPASFPRDFFSYFNRIGRSLEEGESIEWLPDSPTNKTILTPAKRIRLALHHRENYEAEANVVGLVEELDAKKRTGTFRTLDGSSVTFAYDDPFFSDLKDALGLNRAFLRVRGIGLFDRKERLVSLNSIEAVEPTPNYPLVSAVEKLAQLKEGWLDGIGAAPSTTAIASLVANLAKTFPESLDYPAVAPTETGGVVLEWILSNARIELEFDFQAEKIELYATHANEGEPLFTEQIYDVSDLSNALGHVEGLLLL